MQYALMKVSDNAMVLMDASEAQALYTYKGQITDVPEPDEENLPLKVVYGAYKPQHGKGLEETIENLNASKGFWHGHVKDDKCYKIAVVDFITLDPVMLGQSFYIPFASLVSTNIDLKNKSRTFAITTFLRYENRTPAENILNRNGVFSIASQENRIKNEIVTEKNWKDFVDMNRAKRAASKIF
ncbi:hypothetical protein IRT38_00205 (plasmid) [Acinetobacter sp. SK-43]|uniref:hypothetical protein n=1 Tax=Pseudomonadota TaxID=1224 RepID=UPI0012BE0E5A|nr:MULTISPECIES: hypothetical protein [Pseudomonadota]MBF4453835.1 hypothetical protein [Acinetobacter sp. SK-43]MPS92773.1 hypothetical protein [Comamonas sp.]